MTRSEAETLLNMYWTAGLALVSANNQRILPEFDGIREQFRDARQRVLDAMALREATP